MDVRTQSEPVDQTEEPVTHDQPESKMLYGVEDVPSALFCFVFGLQVNFILVVV